MKEFFIKVKRILKHVTKKQWIILGVLVLILVVLLITVSVVKNDNDKNDVATENENTSINDSAGIIKEANYDGLTINNIILMSQGDYSTYTATVTNNSGEDKNIEDFDIVLKKGDKEVVTLYAYLGDTLKNGESREVTASVGMKLSKKVVDTAEYQEHK